MRASAAVVAEIRPGTDTTRCTTLRSTPPLSLRQTPRGLHLVGSAAGPLGGDDLRLDITVVARATLTIRSVAAQLIQPGSSAGLSASRVTATVGDGAELRWLPEPMVLVRGADHRVTTTIDLAATAGLWWREVAVLGRFDEAPGSLLQRLRVDRGGRPLLRTDLALGPLWPGASGPAGTGTARVVGAALLVGPHAEALAHDHVPDAPGVRAAIHPLAPDAILLTALGDDCEPVAALLDRIGAA